jgi:NAD(P)H dehydrogenase (quinone)
MKKVLVILGHPRLGSYCNALSQAYERGASEAGAEVRRLELARLEFDPIFKLESETRFSGEQNKGLEPDLIKAQQDIAWADHLVFIYPSWWGSFPTLLKGFIDRTFTPGFAFKYQQGKTLPEQLLKGKTARLIVTMDTPSWWNMRHATLYFCGIRPVKITDLAGMRNTTVEKRTQWLEHIRRLAVKEAATFNTTQMARSQRKAS